LVAAEEQRRARLGSKLLPAVAGHQSGVIVAAAPLLIGQQFCAGVEPAAASWTTDEMVDFAAEWWAAHHFVKVVSHGQ